MKTYVAKPGEIKRNWHIFDATDRTLGRMAAEIARLLMGKHKPIFTPNADTGDYVVVINAAKLRVTGNKTKQKLYYRHSGYPGGLRSITLEKMMATRPDRVVEYAVKGMLPGNRLGAQMRKKLKIYAGEDHPHVAQTGAGPAKAAE